VDNSIVKVSAIAYNRSVGEPPVRNPLARGRRKKKKMITALVQIQNIKSLSRQKVKELASESAPRYQPVQGLIRKYYILSEDGKTAGGVYLWKSRGDAERLYTEEWKKHLEEIYGSMPSINYFQSYVVVDNKIGEIVEED
jgi:hypothetical protein